MRVKSRRGGGALLVLPFNVREEEEPYETGTGRVISNNLECTKDQWGWATFFPFEIKRGPTSID